MDSKPDMRGKTVVITGATSGIGLATALELVGMGASVIGVGRSQKKCNQALEIIRKKFGIESISQECGFDSTTTQRCGSITFLTADLSSMTQVRRLAEDIREEIAKSGTTWLDVLINNAGAVSSWYVATAEGFELQFAVNYLAAFLLTHELLPMLKSAPEGRMIALASGSHFRTKINWKDILMRKHYNCLMAYKQTKLANVMMCTELNRRLGPETTVHAFAADPGLVNTNIGMKGTMGITKKVWEIRSRGGVTPEAAAVSITYLAADPEVKSSDEVYWKDCRPQLPSSYSRREDEAHRLWEISEKMCGIISTKAIQ